MKQLKTEIVKVDKKRQLYVVYKKSTLGTLGRLASVISPFSQVLSRRLCSLRSLKMATTSESSGGFPGVAVVKNPPGSAGDTGLSPGPGRSHMPWSN